MTVAEYARLHGLTWRGAKKRLDGATPRAECGPDHWLRGNRKVTPEATVARIRALLAEGNKHDWIAYDCGVCRSTVTLIANGKRHNRRKRNATQ